MASKENHNIHNLKVMIFIKYPFIINRYHTIVQMCTHLIAKKKKNTKRLSE